MNEFLININTVPLESKETISFNNKQYKGYYISYNRYDRQIYGCDTTFLVLGQIQAFFILNGNYVENYKKCIDKNGFIKCYKYYQNNKELHNKNTNTIESLNKLEKIIQSRRNNCEDVYN